jgi:hybrid cluster-associated redox disulfide protein
MIKKEDNLKEAFDKYPEIGAVLAEYGLHCVGCHASLFESIKEGCVAHGMDEKTIDEVVLEANKKIKEFDLMKKLCFTKRAIEKLKERLGKEKYIRVFPVFEGFDFEATSKKSRDEIELKNKIIFLINPKVERFLRGVTIDFNKKENDFVGKRE